MFFRIKMYIYLGETVGRWTGTEVSNDYGNQVSYYFVQLTINKL